MGRAYRIYTENKNKDKVAEVVSGLFDGFTMFEAEGYWKGVPEKSLVVELVGTEEDFDRVLVAADLIKMLNDQESVLVQSSVVKADFTV